MLKIFMLKINLPQDISKKWQIIAWWQICCFSQVLIANLAKPHFKGPRINQILKDCHDFILSVDKCYFSSFEADNFINWMDNARKIMQHGKRVNEQKAYQSSIKIRTNNTHHSKHKTFIQHRPNVFDVGPTLYKCYTNVVCLLRCQLLTISPSTFVSTCVLLSSGWLLYLCQVPTNVNDYTIYIIQELT